MFQWPNSTRGGGFRPGTAFRAAFHSRGAAAGQLLVALKGSIQVIVITTAWRKRLKTSNLFSGRKQHAPFITFFLALLLVCSAALAVSAQSVAFSPYPGESDGVSVGGKWMEFHSEDKMTGAKKVRFELLADNYLSEDPTTSRGSNSPARTASTPTPTSIPGSAWGRPTALASGDSLRCE